MKDIYKRWSISLCFFLLYSETIYLLLGKTLFLCFTLIDVTYLVEAYMSPGLHIPKKFSWGHSEESRGTWETSIEDFTQEKNWIQVLAQLLRNFVSMSTSSLSLQSKGSEACLAKLFYGRNGCEATKLKYTTQIWDIINKRSE